MRILYSILVCCLRLVFFFWCRGDVLTFSLSFWDMIRFLHGRYPSEHFPRIRTGRVRLRAPQELRRFRGSALSTLCPSDLARVELFAREGYYPS